MILRGLSSEDDISERMRRLTRNSLFCSVDWDNFLRIFIDQRIDSPEQQGNVVSCGAIRFGQNDWVKHGFVSLLDMSYLNWFGLFTLAPTMPKGLEARNKKRATRRPVKAIGSPRTEQESRNKPGLNGARERLDGRQDAR